MENEGEVDTNCNWCARYNPQRISKGTGRLGNKKTSGDHPNYSIIQIGQNAKKKPGDLRRLAVTQAPVENHQLKLVWKTLKRVTIIIIIPNTLLSLHRDLSFLSSETSCLYLQSWIGVWVNRVSIPSTGI